MSSSDERRVRRMPIRTADVELTDDYEGWHAKVRVNVPLIVVEELQAQDMTRIKTALGAIILEWDFVDEEGQPLKQPNEGGLDALPIDLYIILVKAFLDKLNILATVPKA